jgi:hypothetical protein
MSLRPEPTKTGGSGPAVAEPETVSPYLHDRGNALYNPLTGKELSKTGPSYEALVRIGQGRPDGVDPLVLEHLKAERFVIDDVFAESRRTHLLYVSLETCTSCNHRCRSVRSRSSRATRK